MIEVTANKLIRRVRTYLAKGSAYSPTEEEAIRAAAEGRLYEVDTKNAGEDCLFECEHDYQALENVAALYAPDEAPAHPDGSLGWARERGWAADEVRIVGAKS